MWVTRRLQATHADWTKDHKRMMNRIGKAMKAGHIVEVTFRPPTADDKVKNAAEVGVVMITNKGTS